MNVAIVGGGTMGTRLALRCVAHGCATMLVVRDRERAKEALETAARETGIDAKSIAIEERLEAIEDVELVAETIPEDLVMKRRLYGEIEALVEPHVPIASGTSSFVPDALATELANPGRLIVAHMVHPVTTFPIVELVAPSNVDAVALTTVERWISALGMRAIRLRSPIAGFIVNRLQFALVREASRLVEEGIVDAEEVDAVVEYALGPRWAATGPLASVELGGRRTFATIARHLTPELDARDRIPLLENEAPLRAWSDEDRAAARELRTRVYQAIEAVRETS